jgi:hypothetical protein
MLRTPVRTPPSTPVERDTTGRIVGPLSSSMLETIIDAKDDGASIRKIAAMVALPPSRIQRTLERPEVVQELRERRKTRKATERKREQRERDAESAADPEAFAAKFGSVTSATRISRKGMGDLYVSEKTGQWMRVASVGFDRPACRLDFERRGAKPPGNFEDDYGYGQPGYDRPPVGFVPPDRRPIRLERTDERGVYRQSPFEAREVDARLAEGWTRVVTA